MLGDKSISSFKEDKLQFGKLVNSLYESVEYLFNSQKSAIIAVIGSWGIGKTSMLNLLFDKYRLEEKHDLPIFKLDAVDYSDFKYLILELLKIINKRFSTLDDGTIQELFIKFASLSLFTLDIISIFYGSPLLNKISDILNVSKSAIESLPKENLPEVKNKLKDKLKEKKKKLIIIIDDIDRMDNKEFLTVLKLIREFAELPNIIFILSISEESITQNKQFIDKYIEFSFYFPSLNLVDFFKQHLRNYIRAFFKPQGTDDVELNKIVVKLLTTYIKTPRDIKRLINTLYMERDIYKDTYIYDLLLLTTIKIFDIKSYTHIKNWVLYNNSDDNLLPSLLKGISSEANILLSILIDKPKNMQNFDLRRQKRFLIKDYRKNYFTASF